MKIGVIGLGYVGLPLAVEFLEAGHEVVGVDIDQRRAQAIGGGVSDIEDIPSERLAAVSEKLTASTRYADLAGVEAAIIAVPTPLSRNREPDLGPLVSAGRSLAEVLQRGQLVVLESTTYPGTTRERLVPLLEESGLAAGVDFNVAFSPERVDPGRTDYTLRNTPKVVGGLTDACLERAMPRLRSARAGVVAGRRRDDEAAREHLPVGQHRARERARDARRPDGPRHLGDRRCGRHEAVRVHAVRPGPGHGRPLPAGRPVLPDLARA
jgi:nucleotide sugar dehydrogenase